MPERRPAVTEEPIDHYASVDVYAAEVAELALLYAGETDEKVRRSLALVRMNLEDELTEDVAASFIQAILRRKTQIERNAMPEKPQ